MKQNHLVTLSGERTPPSEVLLFGYGVTKTRKGDFVLTPECANQVILKYKEHGVDVALDFEHGMLEPDGKPAPAAGWAHLDLRTDGIWLTDIKWTPKMLEYLKNGEYRYLSPAFDVNPDTREIVEIINVAVTNLPATDHIEALVAANRIECKIRHEGNKWILYDSTGKKVLGTHKTEADAKAQEAAINISKARKAGHKIPKASRGVLSGTSRNVSDVFKVKATRSTEKKTMTFQEQLKAFVLSRTDLSIGDLCTGLGIDKEQLNRFALGGVPSQEEMACMSAAAKSAKLDIFQGEEEELPIDASMNGMDVNTMVGHQDEDSASSIFETARPSKSSKTSKSGGEKLGRSADESEVGHSADEASEDQGDKGLAGAIGMRMSQARVKELVKLTGRENVDEAIGVVMGWKSAAASYEQDHGEVVRLRKEADSRERRELVALGKSEGKLTPSLIKFYEKRSNSELRAFLSVAPSVVDTNGGHQEPSAGGYGFDAALGLTAEEALVESLLPGDPKEFVKLRQALSATIKKDSAIALTGDSREFNQSIVLSYTNPSAEPIGWVPRKRPV